MLNEGNRNVAKKVVEYAATGRRKQAVARVRLALGVGKMVVNGREFEDYFPVESQRFYVEQPLVLTDSQKKYDMIVTVKGGGLMGQAGAVRHGLSRALVLADETLKDALKGAGFLTRDARVKERKKPGQPGARKRFQFSKR